MAIYWRIYDLPGIHGAESVTADTGGPESGSLIPAFADSTTYQLKAARSIPTHTISHVVFAGTLRGDHRVIVGRMAPGGPTANRRVPNLRFGIQYSPGNIGRIGTPYWPLTLTYANTETDFSLAPSVDARMVQHAYFAARGVLSNAMIAAWERAAYRWQDNAMWSSRIFPAWTSVKVVEKDTTAAWSTTQGFYVYFIPSTGKYVWSGNPASLTGGVLFGSVLFNSLAGETHAYVLTTLANKGQVVDPADIVVGGGFIGFSRMFRRISDDKIAFTVGDSYYATDWFGNISSPQLNILRSRFGSTENLLNNSCVSTLFHGSSAWTQFGEVRRFAGYSSPDGFLTYDNYVFYNRWFGCLGCIGDAAWALDASLHDPGVPFDFADSSDTIFVQTNRNVTATGTPGLVPTAETVYPIIYRTRTTEDISYDDNDMIAPCNPGFEQHYRSGEFILLRDGGSILYPSLSYFPIGPGNLGTGNNLGAWAPVGDGLNVNDTSPASNGNGTWHLTNANRLNDIWGADVEVTSYGSASKSRFGYTYQKTQVIYLRRGFDTSTGYWRWVSATTWTDIPVANTGTTMRAYLHTTNISTIGIDPRTTEGFGVMMRDVWTLDLDGSISYTTVMVSGIHVPITPARYPYNVPQGYLDEFVAIRGRVTPFSKGRPAPVFESVTGATTLTHTYNPVTRAVEFDFSSDRYHLLANDTKTSWEHLVVPPAGFPHSPASPFRQNDKTCVISGDNGFFLANRQGNVTPVTSWAWHNETTTTPAPTKEFEPSRVTVPPSVNQVVQFVAMKDQTKIWFTVRHKVRLVDMMLNTASKLIHSTFIYQEKWELDLATDTLTKVYDDTATLNYANV